MIRKRLAVSCIVFLCCVGVALPVSAGHPWDSSRGGSGLEMLLGHYECYVDPGNGTGWQGLILDATGDVFLDEVFLLSSQEQPQLPPDEYRLARLSQMLSAAEDAGCATSEVEDLGAGSSYFRFVCTGSRGDVVRAIAGMAKTLYQSDE